MLTAAKLIGLIPEDMVQREIVIEKAKLEALAAQMTP